QLRRPPPSAAHLPYTTLCRSQHAHPVTLKAAQDGPRGTGREAGGRHARSAYQDVTDLPGEVALQFVALDNRGSRQHIEPGQPASGDVDHIAMEIVAAALR